jgi:acyl-CoA reductase-like NAD-dependent aldehyde dehydrogenase
MTPAWLATTPWSDGAPLTVRDKATGEPVADVPLADAAALDRALDAAVAARAPMAALPPYARRERLLAVSTALAARTDEFADLLVREGGKPIRDARAEVGRAVDTFRLSAEEATRADGSVLDLGSTARGAGSFAVVRRVPAGVAALVSPFNFPLNLVAHKVAPALAAGCPFVLKPASSTPMSALALGALLAEADWPAGSWSILPMSRAVADRLVTDPRPAVLSFTGSAEVGWDLKARAGRKKVVLELGGNAAVLVDETWEPADAARRIALAAYGQAGQSCISVQRILVAGSALDAVRDALVGAVSALPVGAPSDPATVVGPMISDAEADRVRSEVREAVRRGARLRCGTTEGTGALLAPLLVEDAPLDARVWAEEAFGPVACLRGVRDWDQALALTNDSRFGLQAGLLTRDLRRALDAASRLDVGGVIVGDVPTWRADAMPYGGVKDSGLGREGPRCAIEDYTEPRTTVFRAP